MTYSSYTPGRWTAVLSEGFAVVLDPDAADSTALGLWAGATSGASFVDALSVLSREGFASMPAFALAVRSSDGRTNVAVRGPVEVVAVCAAGTVTVEGVGVSTWVERVLVDVQQLRFTVTGELKDGALPLVAGVVRAGGLVTPVGEDLDEAVAEPVEEERSLDADEPVDAPFDESVADAAVVGSAPVGSVPVPVAEVEPQDVLVAEVEPDAPPVVEVEPDAVPVAEVEPVAEVPTPGHRTGDAARVADDDLLHAVGLAAPLADLSPAPDREPVSVGVHALTDGDGGSDGAAFTILSSSLADLREGLPAWRGTAPVEEPEPLPAPSRTAARLVLSTGLVVALDRPVLLGRAPQAVRVSGRELPRLVAVPSPQQDISRTHAEVRVEGEEVLVTDLDSTNGVHVLQPGRGARRLRPGEPRSIRADETIDLGDGVTFIVERGT